MESFISKTNQLSLITLFIITLFFFTAKTDCPIQFYPTQTIIGYINAQINNDPQKQNTQQTYSYTMKQAISTATPDVVIGINAIKYSIPYEFRYKAVYQATPRFGTLNFKVLLQDKQNKWRRLQFNFIATSNPQVSANSLQFNQLSQDLNKTKFSLASTINIQDYMTKKPIIQTYVSGISLRAKKSRQQMQAAMKSVQNLKKLFSWNRGAITAANKMIQTYSILTYELTSAALSNKTLTIKFSISETVIVQNLTVSYIIFNQMEYPLKNNLIYQSFSLGGSNGTYGFAPLQNTDMTFIGLRGAQIKIANDYSIQFTVAKSKGSFNIYTTQGLLDDFFLYVSFLQTQTKFQYQCQNCVQSVFRFETYCLAQCPRGYVNVINGSNSNCKYCNISQFLIPNQKNNQCVCAKQYFYNPSNNKCETCHYSCLSCTNNSICNQCDSLDKTTKRIFNNDTKLCFCSDGYFDNQNLICQKCHDSCLTCFGSSIYQCKKCQSDKTFDSTNRCQCAANFVDQGKVCTCKQPNLLKDKVCYSTVPVSSQCYKPHMIQTQINEKIVCDCQKGYQIYNNECYSCPATFALNLTTGKCQCSKTAYLSSDNTCVQCESMKYYDQKFEKCLCKKQYFEKQDGSCIDCPDKSTYQNGKCQCVFNYYLKNDACIKCQKTEDDPNCLRVSMNQL